MLVALAALLGVANSQVNPYADCCDSYCYREDENPYLYLGTKTAYEFVFGKASNQHIVPRKLFKIGQHITALLVLLLKIHKNEYFISLEASK